MRQSGALMKAGTPDLCHWGRGIAPVVPAGRAWELRRPGRARATVAVATEWQDNWLLRRVTQSHLVAGEPVDRLISDAAVDGRTERQARCVAGRSCLVAHMEERLSRGRGCWPCVGWGCGGCGCGWRGGPGVRGVRDVWSCSYSGAVPRPWFVARPLSKVERGRPGAGAQATDRGVGVREPGKPRAASPAASGMSNRGVSVSW